MNDYSLFARQLRDLAASSASGQAKVDRIRELVELQRQSHAGNAVAGGAASNVYQFGGGARRQALAVD